MLIDWLGSRMKGGFGGYDGSGMPGEKIRNTKLIDISYSYFGLVLGCIDADLCK